MRFGKIDYLNMLPFDVFIKSYPTPCHFKQFLRLKKTYPSKLNKSFLFRRIDAGFISSIAGYQFALHSHSLGIVAYKEVLSVLVVDAKNAFDKESASSNALSQVLGLKGEVLIGNKALQFYYSNPKKDFIDLAALWYEKKRLPFVFGRLCYYQNKDFYKRLSLAFKHKKTKIPYYILKEAALKTNLKRQDILNYLQKIYYTLGKKEQSGLKAFYRELLFKRIQKPKRF
ncbi:MqnA/MqnD/SBP family protein [Helicobacter pylori]|uniref:MqnA/MqnD/SBP family protein n=1 Tax=Helicobacter pylori TaxID=210 RepID=UPI001CC43C93|nr:menaquinone biosynthetic enzyme MqnA/MqnD family protein [Helicobacter pylori]BDA06662.1 chorismate dehydratase [Helicobacter pylori]